VSSSRVRVALLPLGVLVSHTLAYLFDDSGADAGATAVGGHSHLPLLVALAVPLGLAGIVGAGLHGYRGHRLRPSVTTIAGSQAACYLLLEGIETLAGGRDLTGLFGTSTLWWGLAVQLVVAWAVAAILGAGARLGGRLRPATRPWPEALAAHRLFRSWTGAARPAPSPTSRRGPPPRVCS